MTPEPTLTDEELATVTQWVDAGEPLAAHYARSIIAALRASREEVERLRGERDALASDLRHLNRLANEEYAERHPIPPSHPFAGSR